MSGKAIAFYFLGGLLIVPALIWATIIGYYPRDLPVIITLSLAGLALMYLGSRVEEANKPKKVDWAPQVDPPPAPPIPTAHFSHEASGSKTESTPASLNVAVDAQPSIAYAPPAGLAPPPAGLAPPPPPPVSHAAAASPPPPPVDATVVVPRRRRRTAWHVIGPTGAETPIVGTVVLGRAPEPVAEYPDAELVALDGADDTVSKTHAVMRIDRTALRIADIGSANGTIVLAADGSEIACAPGEWVAVPNGSTVELGAYALVCASTTTRESEQ